MSLLNIPNQFISIPPARSFAGISGYVTISENTNDKLQITKQPVQQGATISDHAFKEPAVFSCQIQFKDNLFQSLDQMYAKLQALQSPIPPDTLTPFTITTPKRTYYNMMLEALGCTTQKGTENVLSITCGFSEVLIVPVTTTNVPPSQLQDQAANQGVQKAGRKSALLTLAQGIGLSP